MKNSPHILFLLLLCNFAASLWGEECTAVEIFQNEENCIIQYDFGEHFGEIKGIVSNICPSSAPETISHTKSGRSSHSHIGHTFKPHLARLALHRFVFHKRDCPIIHSARSADRYIFELKRILI